MLSTNDPNLVVTIADLHGAIVSSSIKNVGWDIIANSISLQRSHQCFVLFLNFLHVGPAAVYHHISAKGLNICQVHVIFRWSGCVFLVLERDEEAHGIILFAEGVWCFIELHFSCYWNCHLDLHFLRVPALDVAEKTPEGCLTCLPRAHT